MATYFCAWKDSRGVVHSTEEAANKADIQYEIERKAEARRQKLIYGFRTYINENHLPFFRYDDGYGMNFYDRQASRNKESMIEWIIKNEEMIKSVLNG